MMENERKLTLKEKATLAYIKGTNKVAETLKNTNAETSTDKTRIGKGYRRATASMGAMLMVMMTGMTASAETGGVFGDLADKAFSLFEDIWTAIWAVATIIAVVLVAICLLIRMISKNPRSAETATEWMKRIIIAWVCIALLSLFVGIATSFTSGDENQTTPWES